MAMINYADKVALNSNSGIADINKCNATDMNEIKNAFNNQVAFGWYQTGLSPTFTYVSWDSTTKTGVVNSNLDLTPYLSVGMKIKFTQNSAIKYAFITAITSTQLTLFLGTDYSLNNSAISNSYYSMLKAPYGFPINPDKWSLISTLGAGSGIASPVANTWYSTSLSLVVPIGSWNIIGSSTGQATSSSTTAIRVKTAISTSNNSVNDLKNVTFGGYDIPTNGAQNFFSSSPIVFDTVLTSQTTFYFLISTTSTGVTNLVLVAESFANTAYIKATCAYL